MSTIREAIAMVDKLKANRVPEGEKIKWLSQCDSNIFLSVIGTHEPGEGTPTEFHGYTEDTDIDTVLLAPPPYDELYKHYLEMQIDLTNMELAKYNNSSALYNSAYQNYAAWYNRTHMPKTSATHFKL